MESIDILFEAYLEGEGMTEHNDILRKISGTIDDRMAAGTLRSEDLAEYEEAAARAAFYAGYRAGIRAVSI